MKLTNYSFIEFNIIEKDPNKIRYIHLSVTLYLTSKSKKRNSIKNIFRF